MGSFLARRVSEPAAPSLQKIEHGPIAFAVLTFCRGSRFRAELASSRVACLVPPADAPDLRRKERTVTEVIAAIVAAVIAAGSTFAIIRTLAKLRRKDAESEAQRILSQANQDAANRLKTAELEIKEKAIQQKAETGKNWASCGTKCASGNGCWTSGGDARAASRWPSKAGAHRRIHATPADRKTGKQQATTRNWARCWKSTGRRCTKSADSAAKTPRSECSIPWKTNSPRRPDRSSSGTSGRSPNAVRLYRGRCSSPPCTATPRPTPRKARPAPSISPATK